MPKSTQRSKKQRQHWASLHPYVKHLIKKSPQSVWARRCRKEFNKACTWCAKERNLEAHHILPKHLFPNMKDDLDCSILLCKKCHDLIHNLLLENINKYLDLYFELNIKRKPIKSIKIRNPSETIYNRQNLEELFRNLYDTKFDK